MKFGPRFAAVILALVLVISLPNLALAARDPDPTQRPDGQTEQGVTRQLYLLPVDDSVVQLQTHLASINVTYHTDGSVSTFMNADYRLKNEGDEPITLPLILYPGIGSALPQAVTLTTYGQVLPLIATAGGGMSSQIEVPADSHVIVRLSYRVTVADSPIVTIRYAPSVLRKWRGPTSSRIEVTLPDAIARESWTRVTPSSWTYASSEIGFTAIKWLYDSVVPDEEFIVQFVEPILWSDVQAAEASSASGGPAAAFLARGDLYRRLAPTDGVDESVRERFAAQAIAAYADGIAKSTDASSADLAQMHVGLATLYRNRAAQPGRNTASHAALMVDEATAALANLEVDDTRRVEMQQWLADGLRTLFADARARGDWQRVSRVVEQMETLPPGVVDTDFIEEGRQIVLVQQALQLMRRGEHDTAAKLVGADITAEAAAAPAELNPLFTSWHVSMTAKPDTIEMNIEAVPAPGREAEAHQTLDTLTQAWQAEMQRSSSSDDVLYVSDTNSSGTPGTFNLQVEAPASVLRDVWATYVPGSGDFAFLRSTMSQLSPENQEETRFFQREVERGQPMDLREAGNQWATTAADIDRQAAEIQDLADTENGKAQLLAEMQAANYRKTADAWRDLARDSWLRFQFHTEDGPTGESRAWFATTASPPVVFSVQTQAVDMSVVVGLALAVVAGVAALSGVLWWLL